MKYRSARQFGRVSTIVLACALGAAALPAHAAPASTPQDDSYAVNSGHAFVIVAPGVVANDGPIADDNAVVNLVSGPAHGALELAADGGFSYTGAKGFTGQDGFRYGVTRGYEYGEANVSLSVGAPTDLALTATVSAAVVEIGSTVTFTFDILNKGATDADDVKLLLSVPFRGGVVNGGIPQADPRCLGGRAGTWVCSMGRLAPGTTAQAALTFFPSGGGYVHVEGLVSSARTDMDAADNNASAEAMVGRLSVNPGVVVGRTLWIEPNGRGRNALAEVAFDNESPQAIAFDVQVSDPDTGEDIVPSWFSVTPNSATLDAFSSQTLTVRMSATNLAPGLKRGVLHITHDSLFSVQDVPVSFTVAFRDVNDAQRPDDAYIHALAGAHVTAGCSAGFFCPDEALARAGSTVWLLLAREGSGYEPSAPEGLFQDVQLDRPEAPFIEDLVRRGVADGCDAELFCPDQPLARADAAVMVLRILDGVRYEPVIAPAMFSDMGDDVRAPWVDEAVRRGLFTSCSTGPQFFCPNDGITRGDAAMSVVKAFNLPLY